MSFLLLLIFKPFIHYYAAFKSSFLIGRVVLLVLSRGPTYLPLAALYLTLISCYCHWSQDSPIHWTLLTLALRATDRSVWKGSMMAAPGTSGPWDLSQEERRGTRGGGMAGWVGWTAGLKCLFALLIVRVWVWVCESECGVVGCHLYRSGNYI